MTETWLFPVFAKCTSKDFFENDRDLALLSIYADPPTADVQPGFIPSINLALNTTISECRNIWILFIYLAMKTAISEYQNI